MEFDPLLKAMLSLQRATVLDRQPNTLTVSMPMSSGAVKLSFFSGPSFGRVGDPDRVDGKVPLASALLATKLKTIHDRIEAKDYLDIEALLRSGLSLNQGLSAARGLFGQSLSQIDTAKAVGWFKDGDLNRKLSPETKAFLESAAANIDPQIDPLPIKSKTLR